MVVTADSTVSSADLASIKREAGRDAGVLRFDRTPGVLRPLYDGTTALGLTSGGSGDCKRGGTTFYQPVGEAASAYGVALF